MNITEDYVSFEVAELLKEKGFNEYCRAFWKDWDNKIILCDATRSHVFDFCNNQMLEKEFCSCDETNIAAPTLQMAMKYLRKVHNLCLFVIPATIDKTFRTGYALYPQCDSKWEWCASKNDRSKATFGFDINREYCDTYEQANEAAIKYCLENLI